MFFVFDFIPDCYKTQEMCDIVVYCPDKCKTQNMYDEAVDDCLEALELIPDWFVTSNGIKKRFISLYSDDNILYFNKGSDNAVFSCNEMNILNIYLNNINLDDTNYNKDNPETTILIRLLVCHSKFKKHKSLKKR